MLIYPIIFLSGLLAGLINTVSGGGSILTLPVLILTGIPSVQANATNRIGILLQNFVSTSRFHHYKQLQIKPIVHITIAAVLGSIIGTISAVNINTIVFDKILAVVFLIILPVIFLPKPQIENRRLPKWLECLIFFFIGIYGGMIQVGVGFILLASLNLVENFNLIKANAAKVFIIFCYTVIAVGLFAFSSKIIWVYGIILALGNATGGYLGVLIAVKGGEKIIKIILTLAILTTFLKLVGIIQLPSF